MGFQLSYYAKQRLVKRIIDAVMIIFLVITLFPIFWMVYCSVKDNTDILTGKIFLSRASNDVIEIKQINNDLFIGTSDGRISRMDKKGNIIKSLSAKSSATSFFIDEKIGWIATSNKGLIKIDLDKMKKISSFKYPLFGVDVNKIASSVIHKDGNKIWISLESKGFEGVLEFNTETNSFIKLIDIKSGLTPFQVLTLAKVKDELFVGGDKGLIVVDLVNGKLQRTIPLEIDGSTTKVWRIVPQNGTLLLGTSSGLIELGRVSGRVLRRYSIDTGLASDQVGQIKVYDDLIALGSNQGLSIINKKDNTITNFSAILQPVKGKKNAALVGGDILSIYRIGNILTLGSTSGRLTKFDLNEKKSFGFEALKVGHIVIRWRNYVDMWYNIDFGLYLRNSFIICISAMLIAMIFATMAAYSFSRFKFPGADLFGNLILATQMIPAIMYLIPIYIMFVKFNEVTGIPIKGTFPGIILIYSAFFIPFSIWILRSFFTAIPKELEEAARIDGCTQLQVFWHIVLPLAIPGIIATGVYVFLTAWDELMFAWVLCNADTMTIPVGIRLFVGNYQNRFDLMMAAATVATIPVMILFFMLQKHIVKGLTAGAVKG